MENTHQNLPHLIDRAQAGDTEAFGEICLLVESRLLRQAMALCGDEQLAEELAHDTLVEAWRGLKKYNRQCQFFTWLCAILINRHRNTLRAKRTHPEAPDGFNSSPAATEPSPSETLEQCEQAAEVRKCLAALAGKHQEVIYLRFYVDQSLDGIAAALGCSVGTVKSRLFHALEKLRQMKALRAEAVEPEMKVRKP